MILINNKKKLGGFDVLNDVDASFNNDKDVDIKIEKKITSIALQEFQKFAFCGGAMLSLKMKKDDFISLCYPYTLSCNNIKHLKTHGLYYNSDILNVYICSQQMKKEKQAIRFNLC